MFDQTKFTYLLAKYRKQIFLTTGIGIGMVTLFLGISQLPMGPESHSTLNLPVSDTSTREKIIVEIAGAVKNPGVYRLEEGSRVSDLVRIAGGITKKADLYELARNTNLADLVADRQKLYISFLGENSQTSEVKSLGTDSLISVNTASQSELESLEGIGEKRASEIILQRPYQTIEELVEKKIVGESLFKSIQPLIKL